MSPYVATGRCGGMRGFAVCLPWDGRGRLLPCAAEMHTGGGNSGVSGEGLGRDGLVNFGVSVEGTWACRWRGLGAFGENVLESRRYTFGFFWVGAQNSVRGVSARVKIAVQNLV